MNTTTQTLPSGIVVASSSTNIKVNLDRPWQLKLTQYKPRKCPFEGERLGDKAQRFPHICRNWLAIDNVQKTSGVNKLIMPEKCWDEARIQNLGGAREIEKAFKISACLEPQINLDGLLFLVQIGYNSGASIPWHLHWQLQTLEEECGRTELDQFLGELQKSGLVLARKNEWKAILGGRYAGQCFFLPDAPQKLSSLKPVKELSLIVTNVVDLYNKKFVSVEGLPPSFQIGFVIDTNGNIQYGIYKPSLYHQWGIRDTMGDFGLRVKLPWPHTLTLQYLLS